MADAKDIVGGLQWVIIGYLGYKAVQLFGGDKTEKAVPVPPGWEINKKATITFKQAQEIADSIKTTLESNKWLGKYDVQKIDKAMWVLQNNEDVEALIVAFGGNWDGPFEINGSLADVLNYLHTWSLFTNGYDVNWKSIRNHFYNRVQLLNF
jgi:hypothetical protein